MVEVYIASLEYRRNSDWLLFDVGCIGNARAVFVSVCVLSLGGCEQ